ncbi:MAG: hypothetical protein J3K34DRAFT_404931 [Monoraphidium minutum]|nr:MAG: hypothetical protein J3K34DRAFT_404931 [Monoraphidium minutum]
MQTQRGTLTTACMQTSRTHSAPSRAVGVLCRAGAALLAGPRRVAARDAGVTLVSRVGEALLQPRAAEEPGGTRQLPAVPQREARPAARAGLAAAPQRGVAGGRGVAGRIPGRAAHGAHAPGGGKALARGGAADQPLRARPPQPARLVDRGARPDAERGAVVARQAGRAGGQQAAGADTRLAETAGGVEAPLHALVAGEAQRARPQVVARLPRLAGRGTDHGGAVTDQVRDARVARAAGLVDLPGHVVAAVDPGVAPQPRAAGDGIVAHLPQLWHRRARAQRALQPGRARVLGVGAAARLAGLARAVEALRALRVARQPRLAGAAVGVAVAVDGARLDAAPDRHIAAQARHAGQDVVAQRALLPQGADAARGDGVAAQARGAARAARAFDARIPQLSGGAIAHPVDVAGQGDGPPTTWPSSRDALAAIWAQRRLWGVLLTRAIDLGLAHGRGLGLAVRKGCYH